MRRTLLLPILISFLLVGCATSKEELFPVDPNVTMLDTWQKKAGGNRDLMDARMKLRRPIEDSTDIQSSYSRDAVTEIDSQFARLPNPDLVMYIFPHLAGGADPVPVPGYTTIFPMHTKVEYAMPGERLEDY